MKKFILVTCLALLCLLFTSSTSTSQKRTCSCNKKQDNFVKIFYEHQKKLSNLNKSNLPLFICFSGTPGMGKSTITKELEEKYSAVVINSDQIRNLVKKNALNIDSSKVSQKSTDSEYFYFLMSNLPRKNGMIILDMSIDRTYREFLPWASKNQLPVFIIQMGLSKDETMKRIIKRNHTKDKDILTHIDRCFEDYEKFYENVGIDFYLDNSKEPKLNKLFQAIDKKINRKHGQDLVNKLKRVLTQEKKT